VPIVRYFFFVGGALAVLLLIAGWCLPTPPVMSADHLTIDRATIRIKSARKWPEKVVLDTSQPIIPPPAVEEPPAAQSVSLSSEEVGDQSNLEAMAQLRPATPSAVVVHPTSQIERGVARTTQPKRRITRRVARAEAGGDCCRFGWSDNGQTGPNAVSRWHAASPTSMIGRRSPAGIERWTVPVVAHGTAQ
jgi:hypothetical protein